ncbi:MAG: tetratricopeptide repeat protein [Bacteroidales bacterium]|nr:tetratricopeptide repeat protein [Bacteroidales bacterium]MCF8404944.1 tetratricopeptide repeat protein [Bacteroidales bacterium]
MMSLYRQMLKHDILIRYISNKNHFLYLFLLLVSLGVSSCSTKKNSFTRRVFHNLTGHYNTFWNGRESYREGVMELDKKVKDNYNKVLLIFNYGTQEQAQALNPYLDKAIEKASINIQRHSMYFNRKEYVRWIDDSYMLIGLSYFYKQDYNKARRTFDYVISEYKYNDIKYEAMLWLAKSYNHLEKYKRAQSVLDNLENEIGKNPKISKKIQYELPLVKAESYLLQEKYPLAIDHLLDAIYFPQKKKTLSRALFILGQINQMEGEFYRASDYYTKVIKKNPPYEMAFNAAINLATSYDTIYGEDSRPIVRKLEKMLKEDKNKDYRDQIYYALADVAFKDGNDSAAIINLTSSVATSKSNNFQKATSALKLGDIYFKVQKYELSQAYYDTAVQVLPEDFPNKKEIELQTMYLTELVDNLIIVKTEDSLQKVASMPEEQRMALIDKIIEDVKKEEERQKELEEIAALNASSGSSSTTGINTGPAGSGGWYFYNQTALSFGFNEFKKKWGNRPLEDNWRLSNKKAAFQPDDQQITLGSDSTLTDSTGAAVAITSNDPHTPDYYLQNLPFTEDKLMESNGKIEVALFNLGYIYKDKLNDNPKAVESFESLVNRYPETENRLESYYQLYRLFTMAENFDRAEYYKNLIIDNFPDTDYAKLLLDPNYFKELEAVKNRALTLYSETYAHYESGHYYTVYSNSTRALKEFSEPEDILARFEYLRALSLGKIEVVDSMQISLDSLLVKYPGSAVAPFAQNILNYLKGPVDTTGTVIKEEEKFDVTIYKFNPQSKHLFSMVVKSPVNINALKVRISDFNMKFYSIENISVTNILLDKETHFVMVGNFDTIDDAMGYYHAIMTDDYVFANLEPDQFDGFVIAQENYPVFYKDKDLNKYLAFFKQNYLQRQ